METLTGTVDSIVFSSEDTGFTVARFHAKDAKDPVLIVGSLPSLQPGESLLCKGNWKVHGKHGKQFEVISFEACLPADLVGIQKYLESGLIKGIGPSYAKKIVDRFGLATLDVIDNKPELLAEVPGIGRKRISLIQSCNKEQTALREVMIFLRGHEVSAGHAQKIYKTYRDQSIAKVSENPFALTKEIFGIGFKTADKIAASLGTGKESPKRIDAGVEFVLRELAKEGHTCHPTEEFIEHAKRILEVPEALIRERVSFLASENLLKEENGIVWTRFLYAAEESIAKELRRIGAGTSPLRTVDKEKALVWVQEKLRLMPAPEQAEAISQGLYQKILVITGGPGTGKSTITKAILRISEKLTSKILLAAPTGRAAKRMSEITYKKAFTIHALLEMDFVTGQFKKNGTDPLTCDLLIVDESSMIDTVLMNSLLKAVPTGCRVIFIGDVDQLPSVGPGNVLKDLIASEKIPVYRLKRIFRQAARSKIVTNAHRINRGYFPELDTAPESDFQFCGKEEAEEVLEEVLKQTVEKHRSFRGNVQLLSPMRKGILGIEHLNELLQQKLNPGNASLNRLGRSFRPADKVMQLRNNYKKEVYNGDIGIITAVDLEEEQMEVTFDGRPVVYEFTELDELVLAYAVSIHKYQGSECDCIILPVHTSHFKLLNKNLLYTGITRGKKLVSVIGSTKALAIAVRTEGSGKRYTGLQTRLATLPFLGR